MIFNWRFVIFLTVLFYSAIVSAQTYRVSGTITDEKSGETLPGVGVNVKDTTLSTVSNLEGEYLLKLPPGEYILVFNAMSFEETMRNVSLNSHTQLDVIMSEDAVELDEVVISSKKLDKNVKSVEMSTEELDIEQIKKIPAFLGEVDVIKSLQLLPGVGTVGEGASGFNVRGGNIDQNLILFDNALIFSSSHLFGFFSVFNSDAVKNVKLYKGGIPARFGGRLSSVLDVEHRSGDKQSFKGQGGIGVVSSRLTLEGPIQKGKSSFIISGRRSYADLFLKLSPDEDLRENRGYFYDLNAKLDYEISKNDRLYLTGYWGKDLFGVGEDFEFQWGNIAGSLRWKHIFNDQWASNVTTTLSDYSYELGGPEFFTWRSNLNDIKTNIDFTNYLNDKHTLEMGTEVIRHSFSPANVTPQGAGEAFIEPFTSPTETAWESALYLSDEFNVHDKATVQYGLRYSYFAFIGPLERNTYQEDAPLNENTVNGRESYGSGELIQNYHGPEPRLGIKYELSGSSSVKASYNRMRQYLHLISNTTNGLPIDIWKLSDNFIAPQIGDQIALGYFRNFFDNQLETSVEVYYKHQQNVLDYKDDAELLLNENIEQELAPGIGRAYGIEFLIKKQRGKFTGWLSYTLSRAERKVDSEFAEETINNGDWYSANYDKRHDVSLTSSYQVNDRLTISANFVYSTGRPVTFPGGRFEYEGMVVPYYTGKRNQDRLADYHRLDLSATLDPKEKTDRWWKGSWSFSLYNVYARRNTFSILFEENPDQPGTTQAKRLSILGTIIPAVTYNFSF